MQAFLGELVFRVGREEIRAPLKTPAWEATFKVARLDFLGGITPKFEH